MLFFFFPSTILQFKTYKKFLVKLTHLNLNHKYSDIFIEK